jgi:hypothetical protein
MEIEKVDYQLAPAVGMPLAARKQQLETSRFIDIRNLVRYIYKKPGPNGQLLPLMEYQDTLNERELVRKTILIHEMSCTHQGQPLVVNDGTNLDVPASTQAAQPPPNGVQNGTQQMQPPVPQYAPPPAPVGPAAVAQVPQQYAPPQAAPQAYAPPAAPQMAPQAAPVPPVGAPPAAGPAEVAAAAPAPGGGRKRRGAAAAPPPAAPPPAVAGPQYAPPPGPGAMVPPGYQPQAAAPAPAPGWAPPNGAAPAPAAAWTPPAGAPAVAPAPPPQAAPGLDLTPLIQRLDSIGQGMAMTVKHNEDLKAFVGQLQSQVQGVSAIAMQALCALHHIYLTNPQTANATQGKANTLTDFQAFLSNYLPR